MTQTSLMSELDNTDILYERAVAFIKKTRDPRCSSLQRHLKIGYSLAMQLKEHMQAKGVYQGIAPLVEPDSVCIKVVVLGIDAASMAAWIRKKVGSQAEIDMLDTLELGEWLARTGLAWEAVGPEAGQEDLLSLLQRCAPGYLAQLRKLADACQVLVVAGNCEHEIDGFVARVLITLARQRGAITVTSSPLNRIQENLGGRMRSMQYAGQADLTFTHAMPENEQPLTGAPTMGWQSVQGAVDIVQVFTRMIVQENLIVSSFCDLKVLLLTPRRGALGVGHAEGPNAPMLAAEQAFAVLATQDITKERTRALVLHVAVSKSASNSFKFKIWPGRWIPEILRSPDITYIYSHAEDQPGDGVTVSLLALVADETFAETLP